MRRRLERRRPGVSKELGRSSPAGGDDLGSLLLLGDGEGAGGGSLPEGFGLALGVVDGVGGGLDVDAGQVVTFDLMELPVDQGEGVVA